jgi:hypothetical protein
MSRDSLRRTLATLPAEAMLPVGWVLAQLGTTGEEEPTPTGGRSYTLTEIGEHAEIRRARPTVAGWVRDGRLKTFQHGREQRVTHAELVRFLEERRAAGQTRRIVAEAEGVNLGAWREVRDAAA